MKGETMKHYLIIATLALVACEDKETKTTDVVTNSPTTTEVIETTNTTEANEVVVTGNTGTLVVEGVTTEETVITNKENNVINKGDITNEND
jgi:hypothetical protein